jgi:glycosyltransferase involved in cell wall biosynthesis
MGQRMAPQAAPAVSVIIPTWNGERFIDETLQSVFAQTFRDHEVIVVDDGSTDRTPEIVERHAARLRCVHQPNTGQSAARNRGAALAAGRYLAFLDHDDCWEPTYLARAVSYLDDHPEVGLVAFALRFLTERGARTRVLAKRFAGERYTTRSLLAGDVGTVHNPVIRKAVFVASGGYDTSIRGPEDCELWLRMSFLTEMRHLPEPLLLYRVHPGNFSKNRLENAREWLRVLDKLEARHAEFARDNPDLMRRNRAKHLARLGREALARAHEDPRLLGEARGALAQALRLDARRWRVGLYLAGAWVPGAARAYSRWRRAELRLRERLQRSRVLAALSERRGRDDRASRVAQAGRRMTGDRRR